ncbi:MAG: hypothetical protein RLZZ01_1846, partial [Actinomycetota bacterium]
MTDGPDPLPDPAALDELSRAFEGDPPDRRDRDAGREDEGAGTGDPGPTVIRIADD